MTKFSGFTLIELIVFILIIGISATAMLVSFNTVAVNTSQPGPLIQAAQLAEARMNVIIHQRRVYGFNNLTDPCAGGAPPQVCTPLFNFAASAGLTVNSSIASGGGLATVTVNVTGAGSASIVARFVE